MEPHPACHRTDGGRGASAAVSARRGGHCARRADALPARRARAAARRGRGAQRFFAPLGHHAAQHPRGNGRRPRVRARGRRGEPCRRVRAGARHRRAELSRGRGGGAAGVPIGQVETARLLDRRALRRGGAAVRRARRARGGGNPRTDAVASELCSGGDALRRGGGAAAARGRTAGDVRLPRGLPSDDDTGRRAGVSAKNPA